MIKKRLETNNELQYSQKVKKDLKTLSGVTRWVTRGTKLTSYTFARTGRESRSHASIHLYSLLAKGIHYRNIKLL